MESVSGSPQKQWLILSVFMSSNSNLFDGCVKELQKRTESGFHFGYVIFRLADNKSGASLN